MRLPYSLYWCFCCSCAVDLLASADPLDSAEASNSAWIQLRAEHVRIETSWAEERSLLESTIEALESRATEAEEELALAREQTAKNRDELDALGAKLEAARTDLAELEQRLEPISSRLVALRRFLPPRLSDALDVSFSSLGGNTLSPGERVQLTVSVMNRCAQFDRTVTCGDEALTIDPAGQPRLYEVIYWGLSHGYALDRAAGTAWFGFPDSSGWRWEQRDGLADPVAELIAIYNDRRDPAFVNTPARLMEPVASTVP